MKTVVMGVENDQGTRVPQTMNPAVVHATDADRGRESRARPGNTCPTDDESHIGACHG